MGCKHTQLHIVQTLFYNSTNMSVACAIILHAKHAYRMHIVHMQFNSYL